MAESNNEHEASVAAGLAQGLLLEHNLTISDLSQITEEDSSIDEQSVESQRRLSAWRVSLCDGVAQAFGCQILIARSYRLTSIRIVGSPNDIAVAQLTYEYLSEVIDKLTKKNGRGYGRTYANSYRRGVVARLGERLYEDSKQNKEDLKEKATEVGTALVLRKEQNLTDHMSQYGGTYSSGKSSIDYGAYASGYEDGESVSLNRQVEPSSQKGFCLPY
jgi:hypothetical protein